ncbi:MAG: hypothetical protein ABIP94_04995 [Planctomycetota bacterium]
MTGPLASRFEILTIPRPASSTAQRGDVVQQALVLDPGVNTFGAVMSDAARAVIGG